MKKQELKSTTWESIQTTIYIRKLEFFKLIENNLNYRQK